MQRFYFFFLLRVVPSCSFSDNQLIYLKLYLLSLINKKAYILIHAGTEAVQFNTNEPAKLEKGKFKLKSGREMNQKGGGEGKKPVRMSGNHTES